METSKQEKPTQQIKTLSPEQMRDITGGYTLYGGTLTFPDRTQSCGTTVLMDRILSILR